MPELSVRKTTEFSPEVLGFQDGEEMRLVKSVERIDQQVGIELAIYAQVVCQTLLVRKNQSFLHPRSEKAGKSRRDCRNLDYLVS